MTVQKSDFLSGYFLPTYHRIEAKYYPCINLNIVQHDGSEVCILTYIKLSEIHCDKLDAIESAEENYQQADDLLINGNIYEYTSNFIDFLEKNQYYLYAYNENYSSILCH